MNSRPVRGDCLLFIKTGVDYSPCFGAGRGERVYCTVCKRIMFLLCEVCLCVCASQSVVSVSVSVCVSVCPSVKCLCLRVVSSLVRLCMSGRELAFVNLCLPLIGQRKMMCLCDWSERDDVDSSVQVM